MNLDNRNEEKANGIKPKIGFKKKWAKRLTAASLVILGLGAPTTLNSQSVKAYSYKAHKFLASQGILMIKKDKGENVVTKLYETVNANGDTGAKILMNYAIQPDFDENDGMLGVNSGHFYDPATGANYLGNKEDNANVRFCKHYDTAVSSYKSGNKELAYQELGRSLHYIGDMSQPQHSANILGMQHDLYEVWADGYYLNYAKGSAPQDVYSFASGNNVWIVGHDAANKSKPYAKYINTLTNEIFYSNRNAAATNTMPYAQYITAGVINKFLTDVEK